MTPPSPTTAEQPSLERDKRTAVVAWIALSAITVVAWRLTPGHSGTATQLSRGLICGIVLLGAIKCRLIIRYFMEVRHAPRWLKIATDGWVLVLWLALLGIYLYP
jgi:hypothetical protein